MRTNFLLIYFGTPYLVLIKTKITGCIMRYIEYHQIAIFFMGLI